MNENALDATYIGNQTYELGPNPFQTHSENITVESSNQQYSGVPVIPAYITGTKNSSAAYYNLDFNVGGATLVWASNCTQNLTGTQLSCAEAPTNM